MAEGPSLDTRQQMHEEPIETKPRQVQESFLTDITSP